MQMEDYQPPVDPPESKEDAKGKKRKRAKKDPNAPKKGATAFMLFSNKQRPKVREENPSLPMPEVKIHKRACYYLYLTLHRSLRFWESSGKSLLRTRRRCVKPVRSGEKLDCQYQRSTTKRLKLTNKGRHPCRYATF
jgi:hypothetical protein